jgi:hypothetical protein
LRKWRERSAHLCSLHDVYEHLVPPPAHAITFEEVDGRSGTLACQGPAVKQALRREDDFHPQSAQRG